MLEILVNFEKHLNEVIFYSIRKLKTRKECRKHKKLQFSKNILQNGDQDQPRCVQVMWTKSDFAWGRKNGLGRGACDFEYVCYCGSALSALMWPKSLSPLYFVLLWAGRAKIRECWQDLRTQLSLTSTWQNTNESPTVIKFHLLPWICKF